MSNNVECFFALAIRKRKKIDVFHAIIGAVAFHLIIFASPVIKLLHLPGIYVKLDDFPFSLRVFILVMIGIGALIAGALVPTGKLTGLKLFNSLKKEWDEKRTPAVFLALFFVYLATKIIWLAMGGFYHIGQSRTLTENPFFSALGFLNWTDRLLLVIAFCLYFSYRKKNDSRYRRWQIIAFLMCVIEFGYGFFSGSRYTAAVSFVIYLITRHYCVGPSFRRILIVGAFVLMVIMPLVNSHRAPETFRQYAIKIEHQQFPPDENQKKTTTDLGGVSAYAVDSGVGRISQYPILHHIIEGNEPLWLGKDLMELATTFGPPRFIWKNKPISVNSQGNAFGKKIGIIPPDDFGTGIAPTVLGDWYLNFGIAGIVGGMVITGFFLKILYEILIQKTGKSLSGIMIYSIVWIQVMHGLEGWIAPSFAGLVKLLILLWIVHFALTSDFIKIRVFIKKYVRNLRSVLRPQNIGK